MQEFVFRDMSSVKIKTGHKSVTLCTPLVGVRMEDVISYASDVECE